MGAHPARTGQSLAWRLAAFYAALFVGLGVQLPFLPVWLAAKGLDAGEIGVVLAIPMIVRVFAIPVATRAADRRDALRATIVVAATAAVAGYGAVGLAGGAPAMVRAAPARARRRAPRRSCGAIRPSSRSPRRRA